MQLKTHTYTHAHTHTHSLAHTHIHIHVFGSSKCLQRHSHTRTHIHTPTLVYPHNLYSPAFTCTHQNDVEYATQVHTHTHPLLLMLQIHVFGSSKCLQSYIHTEVPNPRLHTKRSRACMLKSPFSVEASARRCTHIHSGTHTYTPIHTHVATRA